jgi:hypothetical protein
MEKQFLIDDLKLGESWRLFKIMGEFVEGVEGLHDLGLQSAFSDPPEPAPMIRNIKKRKPSPPFS